MSNLSLFLLYADGSHTPPQMAPLAHNVTSEQIEAVKLALAGGIGMARAPICGRSKSVVVTALDLKRIRPSVPETVAVGSIWDSVTLLAAAMGVAPNSLYQAVQQATKHPVNKIAYRHGVHFTYYNQIPTASETTTTGEYDHNESI